MPALPVQVAREVTVAAPSDHPAHNIPQSVSISEVTY